VDVDLSLVYKTDKRMSRRQCVVRHVETNLFFLVNKGKATVFVDGSPVLFNERIQLRDKCLIEVFAFLFSLFFFFESLSISFI